MKFTKKAFITLSAVAALIASFPQSMLAANSTVSHESRKYLFMYGPSGGISYSNTLIVKSIISNSEWSNGNGSYSDSIKSDASASISNTGLSCGGTLDVRRSTSFGGGTINLTTQSSYLTDPNTTIVGYNNGGYNFGWGPKPYSVTVNNNGYYNPNPSQCYGGGSQDDTWTYSSQ